MSRRLHSIVLLLRSLSDFTYEPETSCGKRERLGALPGEGPSKRVECPDCGGEGLRRVRGMLTPCVSCGGNDDFLIAPHSLHIDQRRGRGWIEVDGYTERKVGSADTETVIRKRRVPCDACIPLEPYPDLPRRRPLKGTGIEGGRSQGNPCRRCEGSGSVEVGSARLTTVVNRSAPLLGAGDPILACLERREKAGSYEELGLALAALRSEHRPWFVLVSRVVILGKVEPEHLPSERRWMLVESFIYLARLMPAEIRVPHYLPAWEKRRKQVALRGLAGVVQQVNGDEEAA